MLPRHDQRESLNMRARLFITHVCFCRTTTQVKQQDTRFLFFSISVSQPPLPVWPTRPISLTLTQTLLPQLTAWSQFMAGEPKRTKNGQKDKRGGALGSSFPGFPSRAVLGWWFYTNHPCVAYGRALNVMVLLGHELNQYSNRYQRTLFV